MKYGNIFRVVLIGTSLVILSNVLTFGVILQVEYIEIHRWDIIYTMVALTIYLFAFIFSDIKKRAK